MSVYWIIPIVLIIKNPHHTKSQMNFKECYFMYSLAYVALSDIIAYVTPIISLIVFQFLIYFALKKKDRIVNPIIDNLKLNLKKNLLEMKKKEKKSEQIEKKNSFDLGQLGVNSVTKRKTSLNSIILSKFNETSFK